MAEPLEENINPQFIDSDSADTKMPEGAVRYILNCSVGSSEDSSEGVVTNKAGNVMVVFAMPSGTNLCIGTFEDNVSKTIFFHVYNSLGNHQILRYFINDTNNGYIETVLLWSGLNYQAMIPGQRDFLVTGMSFVDDMLYWTDNFNGPRKINVKKAAQKNIIANIYFGTTEDGTFLTANNYSITTTVNGVTTVYTNAIPAQPTLDALVIYFVVVFRTSMGTIFLFTDMGNYVQIESYDTQPWVLSASVSQGVCQLIYQNAYPLPFVEDYISLGKYPPTSPPTFTYANDPKTPQNFVQQFVGQFRYRYVYDDYEFSVWSPYSKLAYPNDPDYNYIEIDFGNTRISSPVSAIIRRVEIAYRNNNESINYFLIALEQWQYISGKYRFYNEGSYAAVSPIEVALPNHAIPIRAKGLSLIKDRLLTGGNTEGYDRPIIDATIKLGFNKTIIQNTWTVTGRLRIQNQQITAHPYGYASSGANQAAAYNQPIHWNGSGFVFGGMGTYDPSGLFSADTYEPGTSGSFDQKIPDAGFYVYFAGTNYKGLSTQSGVCQTSYATSSISVLGKTINRTITVEEKSNNPLVFDSSQFGIAPAFGGTLPDVVLYGSIYETHRQALRYLMSQRNVNSIFTISDVIPGEFIMRVASHWVTKGGGSHGLQYDLSNGLAWQQTSTNTAKVAGISGHEAIIILSDDGKSFSINGTSYATNVDYVADLSQVPGSNLGAETIIDDLTYPYITGGIASSASMAAVGYLMDAIDPTTLIGGSTDPDNIKTAISMEFQEVNIIQELVNGGSNVRLITDHNGYFYYAEAAPLNIWGGSKKGSFVGANGYILISEKQSIYGGTLSDLRYGTMTPGGYFNNAAKQTEYIAINLNPTASKYNSTIINGVVEDSNNRPLRNILVNITQNGRSVLTNSLGKYSIRCYANYISSSVAETIIFSFPFFKDGLYVSGNVTTSINIPVGPTSGWYNINIPYQVGNQIFVITFTAGASFLKRGGLYQYVLAHFDDLLRAFPLIIDDRDKIRIPFYTEDLNIYDPATYPSVGTFNYNTPTISWNIASKPPTGATKAAWLRSSVLNITPRYLQWVADSVQYVSVFDNSNNPTIVAFGSGDRYIMLSLNNLTAFNENEFIVLLSGVTNQILPFGYEFQTGDRVRLMKKSDGSWFTTYYDAPIKQQIGLSIVIESIYDFELLSGTMFEIYNPDTNQVPLYYFEIGDFIDIVNGDYAQISGTFTSGDTYLFKRLMETNPPTGGIINYNNNVESPSVSDYFPSLASDVGRPTIYDPDLHQVIYNAGIRWSGKYQSGTFINNLSNFQPLDNDSLQEQNGLIQKMVPSFIGASSVLFVIQTIQSTSIYIEEAMTKDNKGETFLSISEGVIGGKSQLEGNFGTSYPESIVEYGGRIYGFSDNQSTAFRYSRDGMVAIGKQYLRENDFKVLTKLLTSQVNPTYVFGGFDAVSKEQYVLTPVLTDQAGGVQTRQYQESLSFNEKTNSWGSNYNFQSEFYSKVGSNVFVSFNNGNLWVQGVSAVMNNFYGQQFISIIKAVFKVSPRTIKTWIVAGSNGTEAWVWSSITTVPDFYSPGGQETNILDTEFSNFEGAFWAAMNKDLNSPYVVNPIIDGNDMRSEVLHCTLTNTITSKSVLFHIFVRALISLPTQKS